MLPQYIVFQKLGLVNTYWPLVLPKFFAVDAFFIFLMVQFIRGIPRDLDQAAEMDGCNRYQIFWYIVFPICRSGGLALTVRVHVHLDVERLLQAAHLPQRHP